MEDAPDVRRALKHLFATQKLAVLATHNEGQPHGSLVAFAATDDLTHLLFATPRASRKFANLSADGRVAMVIDSRSNQDADFQAAIAATATGRAEEVQGADKAPLLELYLARHPHLSEFVAAPSCAFLRVKVDTYFVVTRFQHVAELHMAP